MTKDEQPKLQQQQSSKQKTLQNRQKQIDYGKNTIGYDEYIRQIPRDERLPHMPQTPDKLQDCSKRSWDGQVRKWRRALHRYDPPVEFSSDDEIGELLQPL